MKEYSKKLLLFSYAVAVILIGVTVTAALFEANTTDIATITAAWIGECAAVSGFYLWKAKNENRAKYAQLFVKELADKYGIDSVARLLETILKD